MSDPPPPPAVTTAATDEPPAVKTPQPAEAVNKTDEKTGVAMQEGSKHQEFRPGCGAAIFSTELCTRPPRPLEGPPYMPVIVRSDKVVGVVDAAKILQTKFKSQCLCIFPGQGWTINDLWDANDIHLETASFCGEMLTFISRDTYYAAQQFAKDWMRKYPDRLQLVGSDMAELYNPKDHFAIVEKIFTKGEPISFPRTFLWHVAHMMRHMLKAMSNANQAALTADHVAQTSQSLPPVANMVDVDTIAAKNQAQDGPKDGAARKPWFAGASLVPTHATQPAGLPQSGPHPTQQRVPSYTSHPGVSSTEPIGSFTRNTAGTPTMSPNMNPQALRMPKNKPRNFSSGSYNQSVPPQQWGENMNRVPSGGYPRHPSGGMPTSGSPQFMHPAMAPVQPTMMPPHMMPPYNQSAPMVSGPMANHYFTSGTAPRGTLAPPPGLTQPTLGGHPHPHQPHGGRGMPIGDLTNYVYYANNMGSQHVDPRAPVSRRANNYNNTGTLYDPYNGTNPKFSDTSNHHGRKFGQNNSQHQTERPPRKTSGTGNRPTQGANITERAPTMPTNVGRYSGQNTRRISSEDDPAITGDLSSGCHEHWIGEHNETVTELFMGDLPLDIQEEELENLFAQLAGVRPTNVVVKRTPPLHTTQPYVRLHAFVSFSSASDTKAALKIRERDPRLRNGSVAVTVTVPRRFYQMTPNAIRRVSVTSGSNAVSAQPGKSDNNNNRRVSRMSPKGKEDVVTNVDPGKGSAKPQYSPQDARSGLHKKPVPQSELDNTALSGSPKARTSKQSSTTPTTQQTLQLEGAEDDGIKPDKETIPSTSGHAEVVKSVATDDNEANKEELQTPTKASLPAPTSDQVKAKLAEMPPTNDPLLTQARDVAARRMLEAIVQKGNVARMSKSAPGPQEDASPKEMALQGHNANTSGANQEHSRGSGAASFQTSDTPVSVAVAEASSSAISTTAATTIDAQAIKKTYDEDLQATSTPIPIEKTNPKVTSQSAQELQGDEARGAVTSQPRDAPTKVEHGAAVPSVSVRKKVPVAKSAPLTSDATNDGIHHSPLLPIIEEAECTTPEAELADPTADTMPSADATATSPTQNLVAAMPSIGATSASSTTSSTDAVKPARVQQVQSLYPFAKPSKSAQKKAREAKKKQQKKEEAEKAENVKTKGVVPAAKNDEVIATKADEEPPQEPDSAATNETPTTQAAVKESSKGSKKSKRKMKTSDATTAKQDKKVEEEGDSGKLIGLDPTFNPNAGSDINKADPAKTLAGEQTQESSADCGAHSLALPKNPIDKQVLPGTDVFSSAVQAMAKLLVEPSTEKNDTQIEVAAVSNLSPTAPVNDTSPCAISSDTASVASSDTAVMSPPSIANVSYAPAETSVALAAPETDISVTGAAEPTTPQTPSTKTKSKKKKKKSKKSTATEHESNSSAPATIVSAGASEAIEDELMVDDLDSASKSNSADANLVFYDPFYDQLSHIEAIHKAVKENDGHYIDLTNSRLAATEEFEAKAAQAAAPTQSPEATLLQQIEDYMKDYPAHVPKAAKKATAKDLQ